MFLAKEFLMHIGNRYTPFAFSKIIYLGVISMRHLTTFLTICLFLSGCSTTSPHRPVKELCQGTRKPYKINGIEYAPQDHYDYDEKGVASWYGPGFHKRSTSCGSIYDMNSYTAAHKTLPIPSVVEVTNTENGKSLHLIVNDRGPFVGDRIIDLSKKAAIDLGTHGKGLGKVRVRALPNESVALANYLKRYGRYGIDPSGRGWDEIYAQEIAGQSHKDIHIEPQPINTVYRKKQDKEIATTLALLKAPQPEPLMNKVIPPSSDEFDTILDEIVIQQKSRSPIIKTANQPRTTSTKNAHYIQVGSFVQKQNAIKTQQKLKHHAKTFLAEEKATKGQKLFTIKLGPFSSKQQAQKVMETVTNNGYHGVTLTSN